MYIYSLYAHTILHTQILVDAEYIEYTQIPIDAVHAIDDASNVHGRGSKTKCQTDKEEYNGGAIAWIPHVPRPHREFMPAIRVGKGERGRRRQAEAFVAATESH